VEHYSVGIEGQRGEKFVLDWTELDLLATHHNLASGKIYAHVPNRQGWVLNNLLRELASLENGPHSDQELVYGEWLDQIVVGADVETTHQVNLRAAGGEHQHGHCRVFADAATHFVAIHAGQHQVQDDQVGLFLFGQLQGRSAVGGTEHLIAGCAEVGLYQPDHVWFIVHDQYFGNAHVAILRGLRTRGPSASALEDCLQGRVK